MTDELPKPAKRYVIAIASQKGGVAKTTTALSLGGAFVQNQLKTLLIDLDPQANLTLALGVHISPTQHTIADVLFQHPQSDDGRKSTGSLPLADILCKTGIPGLDLAPSNGELELAERYLPVRPNYENLLRKAIFLSPEPYDIVLIDCPPTVNSITLNALVAADLLVVPTQPEFFSATALKVMMEAIRRVRSQYNPRLAYRILITLYDRRNRIHRELSHQIQHTFNQAIFTTMVEVDTKLRESVVAGYPISHYRPQTRGANQYLDLAREITLLAGIAPHGFPDR